MGICKYGSKSGPKICNVGQHRLEIKWGNQQAKTVQGKAR